MIRSALLIAILALPASAQDKAWEKPAPAETEAEPKPAEPTPTPEAAKPPEAKPTPKVEDTTIDKYRTPFEALSETSIGLASRAVLFDWRKTTLAFGVTAAQLLELNSFYSARVGGFVRVPFGNLTAELAVTRVFTWGSDSTQKLSLTPYRQAARPSRVEFDINLAYALVEGVGTPRLRLLPTVELVFSVNVGFRYLYYPGALGKANAGQVFEAIFAPKISEREILYLENERLPGMQIDAARYGLLAGFCLDLYFRTGIFIEPKVMVGIPLLSGFTGSSLGWRWELSTSIGWAL